MSTTKRSLTPCAQHAAEIRAEIKRAHGLGARDVSVRADNYSMGSSIRIEIKSPRAFDLRLEIQRVASGHERVHRDEATGEILSGGNRFVHVDVSAACQEIIARRRYDDVLAIWPTLKPHGGQNDWAPIGGRDSDVILVADGRDLRVEHRAVYRQAWVCGSTEEERIARTAYAAEMLAQEARS